MENTTDLANKEIQEILHNYNLQYGFKLDFPIYRILPDEVQLALRIMEKHKMRIKVFLDKKQDSPQK